jgi:hypothetical protein
MRYTKETIFDKIMLGVVVVAVFICLLIIS